MGVGRYELSDAKWFRIERLLPGSVETVGRTAADNRVFVNGVLLVLRPGEPTGMIFQSAMASTRAGISGSTAGAASGMIFHELVRDWKNPYLMIDSTIVRAHQQAATGRKKGGLD